MAIFRSEEAEKFFRNKEDNYFKDLNSIINKYKVSIQDITRNTACFQRRMDFPKQIAIYEAFKKIMGLPGSILDFGIYKGGSSFTFAHLLETFFQESDQRKCMLLITFTGTFREVPRAKIVNLTSCKTTCGVLYKMMRQ